MNELTNDLTIKIANVDINLLKVFLILAIILLFVKIFKIAGSIAIVTAVVIGLYYLFFLN